jgi:dihydrofolate reductase
VADVHVGMTISVDGYVADDGGGMQLLYPDLDAMRRTKHLRDFIPTVGAVVLGRNSYDLAQGDFTGYEFQVPIFVVTHVPPAEVAAGENERLRFTFVSDGIESAIAQAKEAAGDRRVVVIGAQVIRQVIEAGLADEVEVGVRPVLLGSGLRLFEHMDIEPVALSEPEVFETGLTTQLRFRVVR